MRNRVDHRLEHGGKVVLRPVAPPHVLGRLDPLVPRYETAGILSLIVNRTVVVFRVELIAR